MTATELSIRFFLRLAIVSCRLIGWLAPPSWPADRARLRNWVAVMRRVLGDGGASGGSEVRLRASGPGDIGWIPTG